MSLFKFWLIYLSVDCNFLQCTYIYTVKVVVDGPPGQKVSAQRTDKDRESGRIVGSVPLQTTLSVASGHVRGLHLAQVCPLAIPLCLDI